jgi:phosphoribosylformylglycinamidine cyclo-ligase
MDHYAAAGVDYDVLDKVKTHAVAAAAATSALLGQHGATALDASRGEPAFVFELGDRAFAFVVEGLGTKAMITRRHREQTGENLYAEVAQDTVATIVNDLLCVGALPLVVNAYFASGGAGVFGDPEASAALIDGWQRACELAGAAWGGGESPSLPGLVHEGELELAGAAVGAVPEGRRPILGADLAPGDRIVLLASSGLHANGASLVRKLADELPDGYATALPSGTTLGRAVLEASVVYVPFVRELLAGDAEVTYLNHVTGHGFRKLMRPTAELTYRITDLQPVPEVLGWVATRAGMDDHAAYGTFNMGSGFAVCCRPDSVEAVLAAATTAGIAAIDAGGVEAGPRQVIVEPIGATYGGDELQLR